MPSINADEEDRRTNNLPNEIQGGQIGTEK
jgi:hypothetical protein